MFKHFNHFESELRLFFGRHRCCDANEGDKNNNSGQHVFCFRKRRNLEKENENSDHKVHYRRCDSRNCRHT